MRGDGRDAYPCGNGRGDGHRADECERADGELPPDLEEGQQLPEHRNDDTDAQLLAFPDEQVAEEEQRARPLRDDGGPRRPGYTPAEADNEQRVEDWVDAVQNERHDQRRLRVLISAVGAVSGGNQ